MPGSSWENGFIEWFNARLRNELLNREIFYSRVFIHLAVGPSWKAQVANAVIRPR